jgi:hypothetical protein
LDPTAEPDPDNAGGGKQAVAAQPSAEGFFYALQDPRAPLSQTGYLALITFIAMQEGPL